jgi:hypothetical protein
MDVALPVRRRSEGVAPVSILNPLQYAVCVAPAFYLKWNETEITCDLTAALLCPIGHEAVVAKDKFVAEHPGAFDNVVVVRVRYQIEEVTDPAELMAPLTKDGREGRRQ